ncbi:MAG: caspase family protein [Nitrospira sp.]
MRLQGKKLPASVTVSFDASVKNAVLEHTFCNDRVWKGKLGEAIVRSFEETGRNAFAHMTVTDDLNLARPVAATPGLTPVNVTIQLTRQSLLARTRTGSDDRYVAQADIALIATFYDLQGQPVPDAPMIYNETVKVWTPQFAGSGQCATQRLDEILDTAVEHLTAQFGHYVEQFITKVQSQVPPPSQTTTVPVQATQPIAQTASPAPAAVAPAGPTPATQPSRTVAVSGQDPNRYAVIVGLGLYRSPWAGWREGLALDDKDAVQTLARRFNVPDGHTLLLQDELASMEDIEEALASWLPKRVKKDAVVLFYFSGHATADPKTGEVSLIPYDGTPSSAKTRLISLRWLQSRLQKLGAKLTVAIIDSPIAGAAAAKDAKTKPVTPNWSADLAGASGSMESPVIQITRLPGTSSQPQGLLAGLNGEVDLDHDGTITVGEWLRSLRGNATTVPSLPPSMAVQSLPLVQLSR